MFQSKAPWSEKRPAVLVIACSDGRLEAQTDEFIRGKLRIAGYDRLYVPGGPGALASSGLEFLRVDHLRRECQFLLEAHEIERVVLISHSGSAQGPVEAMCADYRRKLAACTADELRHQQELDVREVEGLLRGWRAQLQIDTYRAEVQPGRAVVFVDLSAGE
jgi:hypothetical protein